jgi:hypothetical protein
MERPVELIRLRLWDLVDFGCRFGTGLAPNDSAPVFAVPWGVSAAR